MLTREEIKGMRKAMKENTTTLIEDITNMMVGRDRMDFYTPYGEEIVEDNAIGFRDKETGAFPSVLAVVKKNDKIFLQCDLCGSDCEIYIEDLEVSYEDLISIADGMHRVLEWEEREKDIFYAFDKDNYVTYDAFIDFIKNFYASTDFRKGLDVEEFMNAQLAKIFKEAKEKFGK